MSLNIIYRNVNQNVSYVIVESEKKMKITKGIFFFSLSSTHYFHLISLSILSFSQFHIFCSFYVMHCKAHATSNMHIFCDTYWPYFKHSIFTRINNYFVSFLAFETFVSHFDNRTCISHFKFVFIFRN